MNGDIERPMLGERFAMEACAGVIKKKRSGGYEISGFNVMIASMWVFQKGAILGRARSDHINTLAQLVAVEGDEEKMCTFFKNATEEILKQYGKEPSSFLDFSQKTLFSGIDFGNIDTTKAFYNKKYRLGEILPDFQGVVAMGIGFGALRPELVKKMWIDSYEKDYDLDKWAEVRRYGLDIPEKQSHVPLAEIEDQVLLEVSEFVKEYDPSLIKSLGLRMQNK